MVAPMSVRGRAVARAAGPLAGACVEPLLKGLVRVAKSLSQNPDLCALNAPDGWMRGTTTMAYQRDTLRRSDEAGGHTPPQPEGPPVEKARLPVEKDGAGRSRHGAGRSRPRLPAVASHLRIASSSMYRSVDTPSSSLLDLLASTWRQVRAQVLYRCSNLN